MDRQMDNDVSCVSTSLTSDSARITRADRLVATKENPAHKAMERGFRDHMMGIPPYVRDNFNKILQVSYDQGVTKARKLRETLGNRPWLETELERDGSKWKWAIYEEGWYVASGFSKTEKEAGNAIDDARMDALDKRNRS